MQLQAVSRDGRRVPHPPETDEFTRRVDRTTNRGRALGRSEEDILRAGLTDPARAAELAQRMRNRPTAATAGAILSTGWEHF